MRNLLPQSAYARNVLTLMTGTSLAQAIPIAISPILTRVYSPEDFGLFSFYMALVAVAVVLVTGRYELAILLPRRERDALNITALVLILSLFISIFLAIIIFIFNKKIVHLLGNPDIGPWLYWVPISTWLMGTYQGLNYWSNRKSQYRRLAISRTAQSGGGSLIQLGLGFFKKGALGLVVGQIFGQLFSSSMLARMIWKDDKELIRGIRLKRIFLLSCKYSRFPKYMILGQLFNNASGYMPIFLFGVFFGPAVVGLYSLSQRVILAPMVLIGEAIGDVYRSEAATIYRKEGSCLNLFKFTFFKLIILSFFVTVPIFLWGEYIYAFLFGEQWREAGKIASLLSLMIFFQGISSPMSQTILLENLQKIDLAWQVLRFILAIGSIYFGYKMSLGYELTILAFSISFSILYIVHSGFQYFVAKGVWNEKKN